MAPPLPHWDMTVVYPSLESEEFQAGFAGLIGQIDDISRRFDAFGIGKRDGIVIDKALVHAFEALVGRVDALARTTRTMGAYIAAFVETNSRDDLAQARLSEFEQQAVRLTQLRTRLLAWIGSLDLDRLIEESAVARDHEYWLRLAAERARHLMSPPEETLAAELHVTGGNSWEKLFLNVWSQIAVAFEFDGESRSLSMSEIRNLAYHEDREVRRRGYEAEIAAWKVNAVPFAAALNSIKGESITLLRRRGWRTALDQALFQNHIDQPTLDAMLAAARDSFPDFRRYLRAKARLFGAERLPFYDLFAPVGRSKRSWEWPEAVDFIVEHFGSYSPRLSAFVTRSFDERWIDAEPRDGKSGGGFCMSLRDDESRILINYVPSYGAMSTVAHELGHAYHNLNLAERTMLQRETPSTLAETASIFCETIIRHAALAESDEEEQLAIIDGSLQDSTQVVVDITSRFLFEQRIFDGRAARELSIDDFCHMMLDAQRESYGDGLDSDLLHPYMWAVKPHYYAVDHAFYNFPYMFGLLFGLGLYARYQADPEPFNAGYDELLSATGMADAAGLASRFGIDIRAPEFWISSLDVVRADIDRFEELAKTLETSLLHGS
ncbi:MAG: M3 family oligoendopeptidase [Thermomicrobiales bacterium]